MSHPLDRYVLKSLLDQIATQILEWIRFPKGGWFVAQAGLISVA